MLIQHKTYNLLHLNVFFLIQIGGHAVTYRSAVGHTVSRDVNSQARFHQIWTLERSKMWNL